MKDVSITIIKYQKKKKSKTAEKFENNLSSSTNVDRR